MDYILIVSLLIALVSFSLALFSYLNLRKKIFRLREVDLLTHSATINLSRLIKKIDNSEIGFEIERYVRRISLVTQDEELITSSLLWFYENGNKEDMQVIKRALSHKLFNTKNRKKSAFVLNKN